jgi:beta-glucanase (GH16 family)
MNKHSKLVLALCLAQGMVLTGCGGSGGGGSSSSSSSSSSSTASDWTMVWSDEFDGDAIDSEKWSHEVNCWGGGNNELQCYTDSAENSFVQDGKLHLVAIHAPGTTGPATNQDDPNFDPNDTSGTGDYTSARLRTKNKGDWKYGRIEVNAKMPEGQGLWPAIWMLPTEWVYGGWPLSGEIDIFEAVNPNASGGNEVHGTLHYGLSWPNNRYSGATYEPAANIWEEFHTYAIEWEEGEIRWYVDDTHYATQTSDGWFTYYWGGQEVGYQLGEGAAPFDQTFHLLLNVAVGGNWPGAPDVNTQFPQTMVVDYVRVYECSTGTEDGKGCASNVNPEIEPLPGHSGVQDSYTLFEEGPATLDLAHSGGTVQNTLQANSWEETAGNVVMDPAYSVDGDVVWDVQFNGLGNVHLSSQDMSNVDGIESGFRLTNMAALGEVRFDLKVIGIDEGTELLVKLDSGWPNVSYKSVTVPAAGEWATVSVRFAEMQGTSTEWGSGQADFSNITSPFVLEAAGGTAHVQVDDIRILCLEDCNLDPIAPLTADFDIFTNGSAVGDWEALSWSEQAGHISISTTADSERSIDVLQVSFSENGNGIMFFQASPTDASAFADGVLSFDIKVVDPGASSGQFVVRADCVHPCSSGDIALDVLPTAEWVTVEVPIADFVAGGLNLSSVNTPFVISPVWGSQSGAQIRLDNIRWLLEGGGSGGDTGTAETVNVFTNAFSADWAGLSVGKYEAPNSGGITLSTETDADTAHDQVLQFAFGADGDHNSTIYINSSTTKNLSALSSGNLVFDIKVVNAGASTGEFLIKGEGGGSTTPGSEHGITVNTDGGWHTMTVPVSALKIPDLSAVTVPISIWPVHGTQDGVVFQLDNIRWEPAAQ